MNGICFMVKPMVFLGACSIGVCKYIYSGVRQEEHVSNICKILNFIPGTVLYIVGNNLYSLWTAMGLCDLTWLLNLHCWGIDWFWVPQYLWEWPLLEKKILVVGSIFSGCQLYQSQYVYGVAFVFSILLPGLHAKQVLGIQQE